MAYAETSDVAAHLGRPLTTSESEQVQKWIGWLSGDIERKLTGIPVDPSVAEQAVTESIVTYMRNPDSALSVTASIDDGSVSKRYSTASGRVELLDHFWAKLGWVEPRRGAYSIRPHYAPDCHAWR